MQQIPAGARKPEHTSTVLDRELAQLNRRLIREAMVALDMLESALRALWVLDSELADEVRKRDDRVDSEEVAIEDECFRIMTLQQPVGGDFRRITFCLKVNADIERVADHATSIAKIAQKLSAMNAPPRFPVALTELGERVPVMSHTLLRAVLDESESAAREIVEADRVVDKLDKRVFVEIQELIESDPKQSARALLLYRVGRELERVGDLMVNMAEDVVYLVTGRIIRHEKRRARDADA